MAQDDEGEEVVDEAFRFAGPATKRLAHTKNVMRQRCFVLTFKLLALTEKHKALEERNKTLEKKLNDYKSMVDDRDKLDDQRSKDLKDRITNLRNEKNKMHEEIQEKLADISRRQELQQSMSEEITRLNTEIQILRSSGTDIIDNTKEAMRMEWKKKEKEMSELFQMQKDILEKEVAHYKKKCTQIETMMRNNSEEERKKMAQKVAEERKAKMAERMKRMVGEARRDVVAEPVQDTTEEDNQLIIDACEKRFDLEREAWKDERDQLELMCQEKELLLKHERTEAIDQMNILKTQMRDMQKSLDHFRELERLHMNQLKEEKQERMHVLRRITRLAELAKEEGYGELRALRDEGWRELRHLEQATGGANAEPTHRILTLLQGERRVRKPKLNPSLWEDKSETAQEWAVFGELRELNQSIADVNVRPLRDGMPKPPALYPPSFEFENLYKDFAHNITDEPGEDVLDIKDDFQRYKPVYDEEDPLEVIKSKMDRSANNNTSNSPAHPGGTIADNYMAHNMEKVNVGEEANEKFIPFHEKRSNK